MKKKRFRSYLSMAYWLYPELKKGQRKPLPACIYAYIQKRFPPTENDDDFNDWRFSDYSSQIHCNCLCCANNKHIRIHYRPPMDNFCLTKDTGHALTSNNKVVFSFVCQTDYTINTCVLDIGNICRHAAVVFMSQLSTNADQGTKHMLPIEQVGIEYH